MDHSPELLPKDFTTVECQEDYQAIKDSVQWMKPPANLKLNESKQGIHRDDQQTLSVIARTAGYTETALKLVSSYDENNPRKEDTEQILTNIIKVQQVQMHYLQDEYASLIVQGRVDKATSQTFRFRTLQKNTNGHSLQNLQLATAISASNGSTKASTGNRDYTGAGSSWCGSYKIAQL